MEPHKHRKSKNLKKLEEYKQIGRRLGIQGIRSEDSLFELLNKAMTKVDLLHYTNERLENQIREIIVSRSTGNFEAQSKQILKRNTLPNVREQLIHRLRDEIKDLKTENQHLRRKVKELEATFDEEN